MGGTERGPVLQPRDLALLRDLAHMRVIDREYARVIGGFHSRTRVNTRLLILVRAGLLVRKAAGTTRGGHKYLYALSIRGARLIGTAYRAPLWSPYTTLAWSPSLEHQLALNRVYVELKQPRATNDGHVIRWSTFPRPISDTIRLIPDAYVEVETAQGIRSIFLEVDRGTETLKVWRRKVDAYLTLATSGEFSTRFHHAQFRVAVVVPSARRLETIRHDVSKRTDKLFWFASVGSDLDGIVWDRVWLRPRGDNPQFLI